MNTNLPASVHAVLILLIPVPGTGCCNGNCMSASPWAYIQIALTVLPEELIHDKKCFNQSLETPGLTRAHLPGREQIHTNPYLVLQRNSCRAGQLAAASTHASERAKMGLLSCASRPSDLPSKKQLILDLNKEHAALVLESQRDRAKLASYEKESECFQRDRDAWEKLRIDQQTALQQHAGLISLVTERCSLLANDVLTVEQSEGFAVNTGTVGSLARGRSGQPLAVEIMVSAYEPSENPQAAAGQEGQEELPPQQPDDDEPLGSKGVTLLRLGRPKAGEAPAAQEQASGGAAAEAALRAVLTRIEAGGRQVAQQLRDASARCEALAAEKTALKVWGVGAFTTLAAQATIVPVSQFLFSAWLQKQLESAQAQKDEAERRSREQAELTGLRCSALEQENAGREGGGGAGKATHRNLFLQTSPSDKPLGRGCLELGRSPRSPPRPPPTHTNTCHRVSLQPSPCTSPSLPTTAGLHLELERQSARLVAELSALQTSSQAVIDKLQADLQVMSDEAVSAWPMQPPAVVTLLERDRDIRVCRSDRALTITGISPAGEIQRPRPFRGTQGPCLCPTECARIL